MASLTKKRSAETLWTALLFAAIFLFFLNFFFRVHPIMIFDTDDWVLGFLQRDALPQWGAWNPAKVLPEVLMPLVTLFGAFGIDPFLQDHFLSVSFSYALTVSLFVTALMALLYFQMRKGPGRLALLAYFLLCHFWIYRTAPSSNLHMLYSGNATCYFNYVVPNLLNCILVLWLLRMSKTSSGECPAGYSPIQDGFLRLPVWQQGLFVLLAYFAVFSNVWASIILAVYLGAASLFDGIRMIRDQHFSLAGYLKGHLLPAGVLLLWAVQQIFELSGGRASSISGGPFWQAVLNCLYSCLVLVRSFNKGFLISAILILLAGLILALIHKEKGTLYKLALLATSLVVGGIYLVLSCAKVGVGYLSRPDVHYGCFFFGMLMLLICADVVFRRLPPFKTVVPLLLVIVLCNCNTYFRTYQDSITGGYSPAACMRFCNDVMQQFLDAEEMGSDRLSLVVPLFDSPGNWPISANAGYRFSNYFYKLGITEKKIEVTQLDPRNEKNIELNLW